MRYKKRIVQISFAVLFWNHFDEEKLLFHNVGKDELVQAACRLEAISTQPQYHEYPFLFYSGTFFSEPAAGEWEGFGNEIIAFKYFLVFSQGEYVLYYLDDDIVLEDKDIDLKRNQYIVSKDSYSEWEAIFGSALESIHAGEIEKVVLSRKISVQFSDDVEKQDSQTCWSWQLRRKATAQSLKPLPKAPVFSWEAW